MRKFVWASRPSRSALALARAMDIRRIHRTNSRYRPRPSDVVINWGSTEVPANILGHVGLLLNPPHLIETASNKLKTFEVLKEAGNIPIPDFTNGHDTAVLKDWLSHGHTIIGRSILNGSGGAGIKIIRTEDDLYSNPPCPLYTKYMARKHEYRLHCYRGADGNYHVGHQQQKRRRIDADDNDVDWVVRNHRNGFVYASLSLDPHPSGAAIEAALKAVAAIGLDFGAVDVGVYNDGRAKVFEVNTAPGLEGTTTSHYVGMITEIIEYYRRQNATQSNDLRFGR